MESTEKLSAPATKRCGKCQQDKPVSEFYTRKRNGVAKGLLYRCKACTKKAAFAWQRKNQEELNRRRRNRRWKENWGLTAEDYDGMLARQGGRCAICRRTATELWIEAGRKGSTQLFVDHSHATGLVRGLLCFRCNRALGLLRDDPDYLERGRRYLRGP